jgi:ABC-type methionine transport system permease subunit
MIPVHAVAAPEVFPVAAAAIAPLAVAGAPALAALMASALTEVWATTAALTNSLASDAEPNEASYYLAASSPDLEPLVLVMVFAFEPTMDLTEAK